MGIDLFAEYCKQSEINFEEVFCHGRGKTYYKKGKKSQRYEFKPSDKQLRQSNQYVIKYFSIDKIYLCWDLKYNQKKKREVFSANRYDVLKILEEQNSVCFNKGIEFRHLEQEKVCVLTEKDIKDFLKYVKDKEKEKECNE